MTDQNQPSSAVHADKSEQERNKGVIRQYFERCWNDGDLDFAQTLMIPNYDLHFDEGPGGYAAWRAGTEWIRQYFSDIHFDLLSLVADGDIVAVRSVWTATHTGDFMGAKATGRKFTARNADFYRLRDGKMIAHWDVNDFLTILWQIGGLPADTAIPPFFFRGGWPADVAVRGLPIDVASIPPALLRREEPTGERR